MSRYNRSVESLTATSTTSFYDRAESPGCGVNLPSRRGKSQHLGAALALHSPIEGGGSIRADLPADKLNQPIQLLLGEVFDLDLPSPRAVVFNHHLRAEPISHSIDHIDRHAVDRSSPTLAF